MNRHRAPSKQNQTNSMWKQANNDGVNNRFNSYQQSGSYIPPAKHYADQQTVVLSDAVKTQYQAESTANSVLNQLSGQRQQLQGANDDVWEMRQATEQTKKELHDLRAKYIAKKQKLYAIIAALAFVDTFLFIRIITCRGSFFCRRY